MERIKHIKIGNFKSIDYIGLNPGRVNIFIGKPNAGKSNLLEAIYFWGLDIEKGKMVPHDQIRYTDMASLFFHHNVDMKIFIGTINEACIVSSLGETFQYSRSSVPPYDGAIIDSAGKIHSTIDKNSDVKKYQFSLIPSKQIDSNGNSLNFSGDNLWSIVRQNSKLKNFAASFFKEFSLEVLYDIKNRRMDIMQKQGDSYYLVDFSMTPDTFQRMLYYLAAIESNKETVLLFEEPEAQSYPPYIQMLAERIIDDKENQYFITTHSPFVVEKMLEHASIGEDVKIFITYYEDFQTKVRELTQKDIDHILNDNIDLFFNMEAFQKA